MLSNIFGGSFDVARQALNGLSRRQETIAGNVANVDTPGYRRREVVFEDALKEQVNAVASGLQATDPRHMSLSTSARAAGGESGTARDVVSERNDANDVSIDEEMLLLVETQLRYQALSQTTGTRLNTLRTIIRG
ncbi:MAG: flagellar basal body rod protein FlgB [Dehalococcoidia bacterium]